MTALVERLSALDRDSSTPLVAQLVAAFADAIATGELSAGEQLLPVRGLAELAGVNQLTAARCYHRLAQLGIVVSQVGRGTFVRVAAAPERSTSPNDSSWQHYLLPRERTDDAGWILGELAHHVSRPELIALSAGYPPPEMIPFQALRTAGVSALERSAAASYDYCAVEGVRELREELSRLGRARGLEDDAASILVTTGARQALTIVARATLRPGDKVACESPTFMGVLEALRAVGAELLPVPIDEDGLDTAALEQLLSRHEIRLLALQPRLHNPTGRDLSPERREHVVELARRHGFFILEDAVYADLRFEGADPGPLRSLAPAHVIYVDSFSKTVAPGLRTGWIAASGPVFERLVGEKRCDDAHSATLPQLTIAEFLATGLYAGQIELARRIFGERRDVLVEALEAELSDLATFARPAGGGHIWLTLDAPCDEGRLYREALAAGVSFVPGAAMSAERPVETQLRLSYGLLAPALIRQGVGRLATVIRGLAGDRAAPQSLPVN